MKRNRTKQLKTKRKNQIIEMEPRVTMILELSDWALY